ncbi:hypothetical protein SAMN05216312_105410 [Cohnella sp. OV330]|uniref:hypothetical protein n=1 Tax=Cohnella sp. OV330 TaxID=1855288 RepID=UPI0008DEC77A|nr:hypothetical protein [Cohnella sp. OV330]SFB30393.1 hypothetical protein SAMN05216312_105410 [Cohnella sp. OV330]
MVRTDRRRPYVFQIAGLIAALTLVCLASGSFGSLPASSPNRIAGHAQPTNGHAVVALVNGEAVTLKEFKARMPRLRGEMMTYCQQTYGLDPNEPKFWSASCGGKSSLERLKEATLRLLEEDRIREQAAVEAGLHAAVGYDAFLQAWETENRERARRVAAGQVIFGPRELSESAYYQYVVANAVLALKQRLLEQKGETNYERWIDEQLKQATIELDWQVYEKIAL